MAELSELLKDCDKDQVGRFISYCNKLKSDTHRSGVKKGQKKNPWMNYIKPEQLAEYFKAVALDGFEIDGTNIAIQSTGISYNYIAYKNKMLSKYPESIIDMHLVHKDDTFRFSKESGHVKYQHDINNPFNQKEKDIIGGYCVIKNKRGEFLTLLNAEEIEKHRKVAKTDSIWASWFREMALKTVIKKACKTHFSDIYQNIETIDNENYDLEQPLDLPLEAKQEIEEIETVDKLQEYFHENQGKHAGVSKHFNKAITRRKKEIMKQENQEENAE